MATQKEIEQELARPDESKSMVQFIEKSLKDVGKALPTHINPERFVRVALTCIRLNPMLAQCSLSSLKGALFLAVQTGLEPVSGQAWILPFRNKGILEAQFIIGYRGAAQLFFRNEKSVELSWGVVKQNDEFEYQYGTDPFLKHIEAEGDRGPTKGFYVCAKIHGGGRPFKYMSKDACMMHGMKHSKTWDKEKKTFSPYSPWSTEPDQMCLKTVLLQLAKLLPMSVETQRALAADESVRDFNPNVDDALDLPDKVKWEEETQTAEPAQVVDKNSKSPEQPETKTSGFACEECGISITLAEHDFSISRFKKGLCRNCQKAQGAKK